jgi:hypothetical protein
MLRKEDTDRRLVCPTNAATKEARRGRPSLFSLEIADRICLLILEDQSLRQICQDPNMPARSTIFRWLRRNKEFVRRYEIAKSIQIGDMTKEALQELAKMEANGWPGQQSSEAPGCKGQIQITQFDHSATGAKEILVMT